MKEKIFAIVPASGIGRRFSSHGHKQFAILGGKPILIWALETLEGMSEVSGIIPVLMESDIKKGLELVKAYKISKVIHIVAGGAERQDSVFNGLRSISDEESIIMIHDGVRPFTEAGIIRNALSELRDCEGVVIGATPKDTIKEIEDGFVQRTIKRDTLFAVQTPQIFRYKTIFEAYEKAMKENFYSTDDSALVEKYGGRIKAVQGSYTNIKVTTPDDLAVAEAFIKIKGIG